MVPVAIVPIDLRVPLSPYQKVHKTLCITERPLMFMEMVDSLEGRQLCITQSDWPIQRAYSERMHSCRPDLAVCRQPSVHDPAFGHQIWRTMWLYECGSSSGELVNNVFIWWAGYERQCCMSYSVRYRCTGYNMKWTLSSVLRTCLSRGFRERMSARVRKGVQIVQHFVPKTIHSEAFVPNSVRIAKYMLLSYAHMTDDIITYSLYFQIWNIEFPR